MCFRSMRCLARQWHLSKLLSPRMRNLHVKPASGSGCRCTTTGTTLGDKMIYMQKNITQRTLGDKCWSHVFWQSLLSVGACIWLLMIGFRRIRPSLANRLFFRQIWHLALRTLCVNLMACNIPLVLLGPTYAFRLWCIWVLFTLFAFYESAIVCSF